MFIVVCVLNNGSFYVRPNIESLMHLILKLVSTRKVYLSKL